MSADAAALRAARPDHPSGARVARGGTDADVALLRRIHELSDLGLNLAGLERVLELEARLERAQTRVAQLEKELVRRERAHTEAMDEYKRSTRAELVRVTCTETALVPVVRPIIRGRR